MMYLFGMDENQTEKPMKRTNFYIPEWTRREFKAECAKAGRDMSDVVRELINRWLQERKQ